MKLIAKHKDKECSYCGKEKAKTYEVELENGRKARLCISDLEKMADMMLEEAPDASRKAGG